MKVTILVPKAVQLDPSMLETYAQEVRKRFDLEEHAPVNMTDIIAQAILDGDLDELPAGWEVESGQWDEDLSPIALEELVNTER